MKKGIMYVFGCYVLWGLFPLFWKLFDAIPPLYTLSARIVWSLVFCILVLMVCKQTQALVPYLKNFKLMFRILLVGITISINWGIYIWAVNNDRILDASLGYFMNPLIVVLMGAVIFREKLSWLEWTAVGLAALGVAYSVIQSGIFPYVALIIGGSMAIYGVLKKNLTIDGQASTTLETLVIAPFALSFVIFTEINHTGAIGHMHGWEYLLLPLMGVVTVIPLLLFARGVREIPYSLTGMLIYVNPTLQLLIGIGYGEAFTKIDAVTFGFIWAGLILFLIASTLKMKRVEKKVGV